MKVELSRVRVKKDKSAQVDECQFSFAPAAVGDIFP
jgi:hypothetical protein